MSLSTASETALGWCRDLSSRAETLPVFLLSQELPCYLMILHILLFLYIICSLYNIVFFFFLAVLGFELGAYTLSHSTSPFCAGFFRDGSHELLAQAGALPLEPCPKTPKLAFSTHLFPNAIHDPDVLSGKSRGLC
jgi:hypothetical protein